MAVNIWLVDDGLLNWASIARLPLFTHNMCFLCCTLYNITTSPRGSQKQTFLSVRKSLSRSMVHDFEGVTFLSISTNLKQSQTALHMLVWMVPKNPTSHACFGSSRCQILPSISVYAKDPSITNDIQSC